MLHSESLWNELPLGTCRALFALESGACRGTSVDRFICDVLRDRPPTIDVSEDMLFDIVASSMKLGDGEEVREEYWVELPVPPFAY